MRRFAPDSGWREKDEAYAAGRVGSRELLAWDLEVLPRDPELLRGAAASLPHDSGFPDFTRAISEIGGTLEIVSDGLGFYVAPALAALGLSDIPIVTNDVFLDPVAPAISFPNGHPHCFVCGTCKRERVRAHQAAGRRVVYVGDGTSDRYAAAHADLTFAKDELADVCRAEGWPYEPWARFDDLTRWVRGVGRGMGTWGPPVGRGGFICGPEVWGPDATSPSIPPDPDARAAV